MYLLKDIMDYIGEYIINIYGYDRNQIVNALGGLQSEAQHVMGWIASYKKEKQKLAEDATTQYLITDESIKYTELLRNKVLIHTSNPRLVFILIANRFFPNAKLQLPSLTNCPQIGNNTQISPTAILMNCQIGNNCIIEPNVVIYDDVTIGNNTIIHAGTVIGNIGLGCERDGRGTLHTFPHYSSVEIGDSVVIGPNCKIPKGTLSPTRIGDGTKIDGLCSIGHNSVIGKNNWIASSVMIAGSVVIGDNCTIYASTAIKDQIVIGDNVVIGMGALVINDIPSNEMWFGHPAHKYKKL